MLFLSILLASANLATTLALPTYDADTPTPTVNVTSKRDLAPSRRAEWFPTPPQSTGFTGSLSISFDHEDLPRGKKQYTTLDWVFMYTSPSHGVNCRQKDTYACPIRRDPWLPDDDFSPLPAGTWYLNLNGEACTYTNDGTNLGLLSCGSENFACIEDSLSDAPDLGEYKCRGKNHKQGPSSLQFDGITRRPVIVCPYRTTLFT